MAGVIIDHAAVYDGAVGVASVIVGVVCVIVSVVGVCAEVVISVVVVAVLNNSEFGTRKRNNRHHNQHQNHENNNAVFAFGTSFCKRSGNASVTLIRDEYQYPTGCVR